MLFSVPVKSEIRGGFYPEKEEDVIEILQEPTESSKKPIRTGYLGHVTGY